MPECTIAHHEDPARVLRESPMAGHACLQRRWSAGGCTAARPWREKTVGEMRCGYIEPQGVWLSLDHAAFARRVSG